jgi:hypothetical protein
VLQPISVEANPDKRFPEKQFLDMKQFELDALVKLNQRTF